MKAGSPWGPEDINLSSNPSFCCKNLICSALFDKLKVPGQVEATQWSEMTMIAKKILTVMKSKLTCRSLCPVGHRVTNIVIDMNNMKAFSSLLIDFAFMLVTYMVTDMTNMKAK